MNQNELKMRCNGCSVDILFCVGNTYASVQKMWSIVDLLSIKAMETTALERPPS